MRCKACNTLMNNFEATRKIVLEGGKIEYPDLCNDCFNAGQLIEICNVIERYDLFSSEDMSVVEPVLFIYSEDTQCE